MGEYLKIQKNEPKMAKNGQNFIPHQHLQANSLQMTKKHMMKLPGMKKNSVSAIEPNWLDTVGPTVQKRQYFKVGKLAKISHFFYSFFKKIKKMAKICHFYSQNLSLIL